MISFGKMERPGGFSNYPRSPGNPGGDRPELSAAACLVSTSERSKDAARTESWDVDASYICSTNLLSFMFRDMRHKTRGADSKSFPLCDPS